ncbi:hypothetical protein [Zhongshania sp.]|uniref:hypothetical protein n=1 Tax=Zhongshania sp. TaxID=1971902 RepID=UPI003569CBF8
MSLLKALQSSGKQTELAFGLLAGVFFTKLSANKDISLMKSKTISSLLLLFISLLIILFAVPSLQGVERPRDGVVPPQTEE